MNSYATPKRMIKIGSQPPPLQRPPPMRSELHTLALNAFKETQENDEGVNLLALFEQVLRLPSPPTISRHFGAELEVD